jgi:hypothetical protein
MAFLLAVASICQAPVPEAVQAVHPPPEPLRRTGVDVMMGSPLGLSLRLMHRFEKAPFYVEGSLGTFVLGAGLGVGLRGEYLYPQGPRNSFVLRPGATWYFLGYSPLVSSSSSSGALGADVDFGWRHEYASGTVGELGFKVGPGVNFRRNDVTFFPILGLYYGWRF